MSTESLSRGAIPNVTPGDANTTVADHSADTVQPNDHINRCTARRICHPNGGHQYALCSAK